MREGSITWLAKAGFPIYLTHETTDKTLAGGGGQGTPRPGCQTATPAWTLPEYVTRGQVSSPRVGVVLCRREVGTECLRSFPDLKCYHFMTQC